VVRLLATRVENSKTKNQISRKTRDCQSIAGFLFGITTAGSPAKKKERQKV
jgi:hypothetical protein